MTADSPRPAETAATEDAVVAGLLTEREGYIARGLDDRVAAVDAELKRLGAAVPKARAAKRPGKETAKAKRAERRG